MRQISNALLLEQQKAGAVPFIHLAVNPKFILTPPNVTWTDVDDVDDLQAMANDLAGNYRLTGDIAASATSGWNGGAGFIPVGTNATRFTGNLDGQGYTISDLTINDLTTVDSGLFGVVEDGGIYNVNLTGVAITGGDGSGDTAGGLIGSLHFGLVSNCTVSGTVVTSGYTGGLIAYVFADADEVIRIVSCSSSVPITTFGGSFVGEFECDNFSDVEVRFCFATGDVTTSSGSCFASAIHNTSCFDCYSTGNVSTDDGAGGFAISASGGGLPQIVRCYSTGNVTTTASSIENAGGFIAELNRCVVTQCYSTGNVSAPGLDNVGGFVGVTFFDPTTVTDCYSRGTVSGEDWVGGFVPICDLSVNCYSTGAPTGNTNIHGFVGEGVVTNGFWDTQTSGTGSSGLGTGKTTAQMKTKSTFTDAGWDFNDVWGIDPNVNDGYPYLLMRTEFSGRVLAVLQFETPFVDSCEILLDNTDQYFTLHTVEGATLQLGWGFVTNTNEYSNVADLYVEKQEDISLRGKLYTRLLCMGNWGRLEKHKVMGDSVGAAPSTGSDTVHTVQNARMLTGMTIVENTSDGLEDIKQPNLTFEVFDSRRKVIKEVNDFTQNLLFMRDGDMIRIQRNDLQQHRLTGTLSGELVLGETVTGSVGSATGVVVYQSVASGAGYIVIEAESGVWQTSENAAGASQACNTITAIDQYDYLYELDGIHTFYENTRTQNLLQANRVICVDAMPDGAATQHTYIGQADNEADQATFGITTFIFEDGSVTSDAEATTAAESMLSAFEAQASGGVLVAPMNVGQELYDVIQVTDVRAGWTSGDVLTLRVGGIVRRYEAYKGVYEIEITSGGLELVAPRSIDIEDVVEEEEEEPIVDPPVVSPVAPVILPVGGIGGGRAGFPTPNVPAAPASTSRPIIRTGVPVETPARVPVRAPGFAGQVRTPVDVRQPVRTPFPTPIPVGVPGTFPQPVPLLPASGAPAFGSPQQRAQVGAAIESDAPPSFVEPFVAGVAVTLAGIAAIVAVGATRGLAPRIAPLLPRLAPAAPRLIPSPVRVLGSRLTF